MLEDVDVSESQTLLSPELNIKPKYYRTCDVTQEPTDTESFNATGAVTQVRHHVWNHGGI